MKPSVTDFNKITSLNLKLQIHVVEFTIQFFPGYKMVLLFPYLGFHRQQQHLHLPPVATDVRTAAGGIEQVQCCMVVVRRQPSCNRWVDLASFGYYCLFGLKKMCIYFLLGLEMFSCENRDSSKLSFMPKAAQFIVKNEIVKCKTTDQVK